MATTSRARSVLAGGDFAQAHLLLAGNMTDSNPANLADWVATAFNAAAILAAFGIAIAEHRRAVNSDARRINEFITTVSDLVNALEDSAAAAIAAADEHEAIPVEPGRPKRAGDSALYRTWITKAVETRDSVAALRGAAPSDAMIVLALTRIIHSLSNVQDLTIISAAGDQRTVVGDRMRDLRVERAKISERRRAGISGWRIW